MTKFVVFTTPRTGSSLLIKTLDGHPEIFCAGEIFLLSGKMYHSESHFPFWKLPLPKKALYLLNYPNMWMNLQSFLRRFYKPAEGEKARGFKLMHFQTFYTPGMMKHLQQDNVKIILLLRENVLKNTLSDLRARDTGVYHNSGSATEKLPKFHVDIDLLSKKMTEIIGIQKELENMTANMDRLKIAYEDFENWDATISKVLTYLDVKNMPLPAASKKLNPDKLEDMIENYAEMKAWLQQKNFAHFLD